MNQKTEDDTWNPLLEDDDPDYLNWNESEASLASESMNQINMLQATTGSNPMSEEAILSTPVPVSFDDRTPSSKAGSVQEMEARPTSQRSLNQRLFTFETELKRSIFQWQDNVQNQLDVNHTKMTSMERKLDMVLDMHASLIMKSASKAIGTNPSDDVLVNDNTVSPGICTQQTGCPSVEWQTPLACEKTSSGSGPSVDLCGNDVSHVGGDGGIDSEGILQGRSCEIPFEFPSVGGVAQEKCSSET
ncbi:hypothetical protein KC19_VG062100 [Ceratodon purpureus]|uniref:Uncharacterized protein n=1 Tax=Ceratodon purpureus TaxID=3225 RepID=A0A8T0HMH4_CERPU|nr:hypothetical protein KC19_VG062100 [Ceratodon purpureus]